MIIVTGTKRSGTSLWMQILIAAGIPHIGDAYLGGWKKSIGDANLGGFYESTLRYGINYKVNPHPTKGIYLHPKPTVQHGIKIFVPGLLQTELAFLHRVIATIRPWREYCHSIRRLLDMEAEFLRSKESENENTNEIKIILRESHIHPSFIWWSENFNLLFDALTRGYPIQMLAYERLLDDADNLVPAILRWSVDSKPKDWFPVKDLDLNIEDALGVIKPDRQTQFSQPVDDVEIPESVIATFDNFYASFADGNSILSDGLFRDLNKTQETLYPLIEQSKKAGRERKVERLLELGLSKKEVLRLLSQKRNKSR